MKKNIARTMFIVFVLTFLAGCFDVAGPTANTSPTTTSSSDSGAGYIGIKGASATTSINSDGYIDLVASVSMIYYGPESSIDVMYFIHGLDCGNSGMPATIAESAENIKEGALFYAIGNYTYTGCVLNKGDYFELDFSVLDLNTGVTFTEQLQVYI